MYFEIAVIGKFPPIPLPGILAFQWKCLVSGLWISSQKEETFRESSMGKSDSVLFPTPRRASVTLCLCI